MSTLPSSSDFPPCLLPISLKWWNEPFMFQCFKVLTNFKKWDKWQAIMTVTSWIKLRLITRQQFNNERWWNKNFSHLCFFISLISFILLSGIFLNFVIAFFRFADSTWLHFSSDSFYFMLFLCYFFSLSLFSLCPTENKSKTLLVSSKEKEDMKRELKIDLLFPLTYISDIWNNNIYVWSFYDQWSDHTC